MVEIFHQIVLTCSTKIAPLSSSFILYVTDVSALQATLLKLVDVIDKRQCSSVLKTVIPRICFWNEMILVEFQLTPSTGYLQLSQRGATEEDLTVIQHNILYSL